jgi:hypothetical protein
VSQDGEPEALAAGHPLRPRVTAGHLTQVAVELPGAGLLRVLPAGLRGADADADLPLGRPWIDTAASDGERLVVRDAWWGVDEAFTLTAASLKHDLLVDADAVARAGAGDLVATWLLLLPPRVDLALEPGQGAVLRDERGAFLARVPEPVVAEAANGHPVAGAARLALSGQGAARVLSVAVSRAWLDAPGRSWPVLVDPTVDLQPLSDDRTGYVDETGFKATGPMVSGSLVLVGRGSDVRAFAEIDLSTVPDAAVLDEVRLQVWLSNHDNPGDPAVPLRTEVHGVAAPSGASGAALHAAIGPLFGGRLYVVEDVPRTGPRFCQDSYELRDYDLGPDGLADLQAALAADWFTVGFVTEVVTDPTFDHVDEIGYPEVVNNPFVCGETDFPGTRITLVTSYNTPPTCDAGPPLTSDCPAAPLLLDGSGSSDQDGDPLTWSWSSDCSGDLLDAGETQALLLLDPSCAESCTVTLTVSDGRLSSSCTTAVDAADLTPPEVLGTSVAGLCAWPPRHDLLCLTDPGSLVEAVDACQPGVLVRFVGCASDQPDEAREDGRPENGDGSFPDDCRVSEDGQEICVRVERAGNDPEGRTYAVLLEVDDGCGNTTAVGGSVFVPHDRRGGPGGGPAGPGDPCEPGDRRR